MKFILILSIIITSIIPNNQMLASNIFSLLDASSICYKVECKPIKTGYIYVGDSRTVDMNNICRMSKEKNTFVVAEVGQGYKWFSNTAMKQVNKIKKEHKDIKQWVLIINLGINDLGNCDKYIKSYEKLKDNYDLKLVSVNPIEKHKYITNKDVSNFNKKLKSIDDIIYIDTYTYLTKNGYSTRDGLHYDNKTYKSIYSYIRKEI